MLRGGCSVLRSTVVSNLIRMLYAKLLTENYVFNTVAQTSGLARSRMLIGVAKRGDLPRREP